MLVARLVTLTLGKQLDPGRLVPPASLVASQIALTHMAVPVRLRQTFATWSRVLLLHLLCLHVTPQIALYARWQSHWLHLKLH